MNSKYQQVASNDQVAERIHAIAAQIIKDFPKRTPLFVALLRGAAPFSSQLMSEIARQSPDYHPELDYMMVSTYGTGHTAGEPQIITNLAPDTVIGGRDVIVIDDVLDKGITADFVMNHLKSCGAATVKLAVLCEKRTQRVTTITPDYCGFSFADEWLVGMGLDDASDITEGFRWLDHIMALIYS